MSEPPRIDPDLVVWATPPQERAGRPALILLHGYGADERDLLALSEHLPDAFAYAAVRAPLAPPWPSPGYSWYPIEGLNGRDPSAVTAAADGLLEWLDAAVDAPSIGLLGFSQGASVALQALRLDPSRIAFVVNLSGYVAPGSLPGDATLTEQKPPVFWGRGTHDDVIPEALVAHTVEWLPAHSDLSGRVYPGMAHSVSQAELADVHAFLSKRLEKPAAS
ncbi:alpha/beta hydrolase [Microbacterium lushaniae]|uniref:Esterase n=1 Tax=Microbacterium lushaniae TaxID=2614639 RepID=A0A5J6L0L1_9MICO|nr:alpha/beta hydrolase-fold protein [Microbacterium lushaniae]QEW02028.1 esterase [Microbacterium lushaniae]